MTDIADIEHKLARISKSEHYAKHFTPDYRIRCFIHLVEVLMSECGPSSKALVIHAAMMVSPRQLPSIHDLRQAASDFVDWIYEGEDPPSWIS